MNPEEYNIRVGVFAGDEFLGFKQDSLWNLGKGGYAKQKKENILAKINGLIGFK